MAGELDKTLPGDLSRGSVTDLVDVLVRLQLLEHSQQELLAGFAPKFPDPRSLARELVQRGWLTPYQVNQLFLGRGSQLVLGSYVILERLGEGGMGQVFKARHQNLGRLVALKVIRKDRVAQAEDVQRFHREIQAISQLSHPNVVAAFDADQVGDTHYFAMEYVEGTDLGRLVKQSGPLPVELACDYVRQAAMGLDHVHARGLIHRDLKPSNLLLTARDRIIKVLDLGVARLTYPGEKDHSSTLTNEGSLMGTPDFVAPEQARNSHRIDARADLYSLGCTLYYLLTAKVPFPAETVTEKLFKHWFEEAVPVEQLRPDVTQHAAAVVRRLLAKRPEDRFASAAVLAASLMPGATVPDLPPVNGTITLVDVPGSGSSQHPALAVAVPATAGHLPMAVPVPMAAPAGRALANRRMLVAGGVGGTAVLGLVVLVLFLALRGRSANPTSRSVVAPTVTSREQQAEADFKPLLARFGDSKADQAHLRRDLLAYRLHYPDVPQGAKAVEMVTHLPGPMDSIERAQIPVDERYEGRPRHLLAVLGERRQRHWTPATAIAISPDGKIVASAGYDGIRLWNASTGYEKAFLDAGPVQALTFNASGRRIVAVGPQGRVSTWDVSEEKRVDFFIGPRQFAAVALTPDGSSVAFGFAEGNIVVGDVKTGKQLARLPGHGRGVRCLTFSADGKTLASGGDDELIKLWDVTGAKQQASLGGHTGAVVALAFNPRGDALASSGGKEIRVWDVAAEKEERVFSGLEYPATALIFLKGGRFLATGYSDGYLDLWNIRAGKFDTTLANRHVGSVAGLAYSAETETLASAGGDGIVRLWEATGDERTTLNGHIGAINAVAFSPDGAQLASAGTDGTARLWDVVGLRQMAELKGHLASVSSLAFSGDGQSLATGSWDGQVRIWNALSGRERDTLSRHRGQVLSVGLSLDGKTLAAGSWSEEGTSRFQVGEVKLWDAQAGRERAAVKMHKHGVSALALSPNSKFGVSAGLDGSLKVWDWATGRERIPADNGSPINSVAFAPNGAVLATGDDAGNVKVWDATTLRVRKPMAGHLAPVTAVAFSPDGQKLVSADRAGNIIVWEWSTGVRLPFDWKVPGQVLGIAFSPDGRHIATANGNSTIYLLRLKAFTPRW